MENKQITEQEYIIDQLSRENASLKILNSKLQFQILALTQQMQQSKENAKEEEVN